MADIVDSQTRSRMMSGIKSTNTKPEIIVRKLLHSMGFRYRLHVKSLPGKPDIVLPRYRAVVFVHGCFWHGHDCHLFRLPATRTEFWSNKIASNRNKDYSVLLTLIASGWRVAIVWECSIRRTQGNPEMVVQKIAQWLAGTDSTLEVRK